MRVLVACALAALCTVAHAQGETFTATHYGTSYNGSRMGCGGVYNSNDVSIAAVSPARYAQWPCGTELLIEGPAGTIIVTRTDACPGCSSNMIDLSEAGSSAVCGGTPHTCKVIVSEP